MDEEALARLQTGEPVTGEWLRANLERLVRSLPAAYLKRQRWFGSKAQQVEGVALRDHALFAEQPLSVLALVDVALANGASEVYFVPLVARAEGEARALLGAETDGIYLALDAPEGSYLLYDATADPEFSRLLFRHFESPGSLAGKRGEFTFARTAALPGGSPLRAVRRLRGEQSNTSIVYDAAFILKIFRKLQNGVNPDLEIGRFLTTRTEFRNTPLLAGYAGYRDGGFDADIGSLQAFVANEGDGWSYMLRQLRELYAFVEQSTLAWPRAYVPNDREVEDLVRGFAGQSFCDAQRLGAVTGLLHRALASDGHDPAFAPEPVTGADLAAWVAGMQDHLGQVLATVRAAAGNYPADTQAALLRLAAEEPRYRARLNALLRLEGTPLTKIRHHGDYHLGQVLRTRGDFVVIDFEGEPARPLAERRAKHLAPRDVAGMLRSFDYAVYAELFAFLAELPRLNFAFYERFGLAWEKLVAEAYLEGYLAETHAKGVTFLPPALDQVREIIDVFACDKAIYELAYEVNNRPDWLRIPLQYLSR